MSYHCIKYFNLYRFKYGILFKPVILYLTYWWTCEKVNVKLTSRYYRSSKKTKFIQDFVWFQAYHFCLEVYEILGNLSMPVNGVAHLITAYSIVSDINMAKWLDFIGGAHCTINICSNSQDRLTKGLIRLESVRTLL